MKRSTRACSTIGRRPRTSIKPCSARPTTKPSRSRNGRSARSQPRTSSSKSRNPRMPLRSTNARPAPPWTSRRSACATASSRKSAPRLMARRRPRAYALGHRHRRRKRQRTPRSFLYSNNENDMTEAVLSQLNAGAPAEAPKTDEKKADTKDDKKKDKK